MNYERALTIARETTVRVPEFEAIVGASERERERWSEEDRDARTRAQHWLLAAAGVWLGGFPLLGRLDGPWHYALGYFLLALPLALLLVWAARMCRDRRFRAAILTRGIAASNLLLALIASLSPYGWSWWILAVPLSVMVGRSLQLLDERDLDGSNDPDSSFEPVKFRGVLTLALVMACADASMLFGSAFATIATLSVYHDTYYDIGSFWMPRIGSSIAAATFMAVNAWGLLRLRTWALFGSMFGNVAIAALALGGMLTTGGGVAISLTVTAAIQLLLPLPILAAALGLGEVRWFERIGAVLLRVVVPAMVLVTFVSASHQLVAALSN